MRRRNIVALVVAAVLIAIQLFPVDRSNPPVQGDINAPLPLSEVLRRSCYDCHSNETHWPWYSYVAPVSWVLAHHVQEGRAEVNFSAWSELSDKDRSEIIREIWKETSAGKMPLSGYLILHSEAALSDAALATLRAWSESSPTAGLSD